MNNKAYWKLFKGNSYGSTFTLKSKITGKPLDITGYKFYFTIKNSLADADASAVFQKSWTSHTNPKEGITAFSLSIAETNGIAVGKYFYGFSFLDDDTTPTNKKTFLVGNIELQLDPTLSIT